MQSKFVKILIVFCFISLLVTSAFAQKRKPKSKTKKPRTVVIEDMGGNLTEFSREGYETAYYDANKYTEKQLQNTLRILENDFDLTTNTIATEITEIENLSVEDLDAEYIKVSQELKTLDIVKDRFWQNMRQKRLATLEKDYKLMRIKILGYTDQKILLQAENVGECKTKYAEPLAAGGDKMLEAWKILIEEQKRNNTNPEKIQKEFDEQSASPDKFKYALLDLMSFGW